MICITEFTSTSVCHSEVMCAMNNVALCDSNSVFRAIRIKWFYLKPHRHAPAALYIDVEVFHKSNE